MKRQIKKKLKEVILEREALLKSIVERMKSTASERLKYLCEEDEYKGLYSMTIVQVIKPYG